MSNQDCCSDSDSSCCSPDTAEQNNSKENHHDQHRQNVRAAYAEVANASNEGSCCGESSSCCGVSDDAAINTLISSRLGYSQEEMDQVPSGADMGLGCGNPKAIAALKPGEVVIDLGAG